MTGVLISRSIYRTSALPLQDILALSNDERDSTVNMLDDVLHRSRTTRRPES
jgi:hypothetical protein